MRSSKIYPGELTLKSFFANFKDIVLDLATSNDFNRANILLENTFINNNGEIDFNNDGKIFIVDGGHSWYKKSILFDSLDNTIELFTSELSRYNVLLSYKRYKYMENRYHPRNLLFNLVNIPDISLTEEEIALLNRLIPAQINRNIYLNESDPEGFLIDYNISYDEQNKLLFYNSTDGEYSQKYYIKFDDINVKKEQLTYTPVIEFILDFNSNKISLYLYFYTTDAYNGSNFLQVINNRQDKNEILNVVNKFLKPWVVYYTQTYFKSNFNFTGRLYKLINDNTALNYYFETLNFLCNYKSCREFYSDRIQERYKYFTLLSYQMLIDYLDENQYILKCKNDRIIIGENPYKIKPVEQVREQIYRNDFIYDGCTSAFCNARIIFNKINFQFNFSDFTLLYNCDVNSEDLINCVNKTKISKAFLNKLISPQVFYDSTTILNRQNYGYDTIFFLGFSEETKTLLNYLDYTNITGVAIVGDEYSYEDLMSQLNTYLNSLNRPLFQSKQDADRVVNLFYQMIKNNQLPDDLTVVNFFTPIISTRGRLKIFFLTEDEYNAIKNSNVLNNFSFSDKNINKQLIDSCVEVIDPQKRNAFKQKIYNHFSEDGMLLYPFQIKINDNEDFIFAHAGVAQKKIKNINLFDVVYYAYNTNYNRNIFTNDKIIEKINCRLQKITYSDIIDAPTPFKKVYLNSVTPIYGNVSLIIFKTRLYRLNRENQSITDFTNDFTIAIYNAENYIDENGYFNFEFSPYDYIPENSFIADYIECEIDYTSASLPITYSDAFILSVIDANGTTQSATANITIFKRSIDDIADRIFANVDNAVIYGGTSRNFIPYYKLGFNTVDFNKLPDNIKYTLVNKLHDTFDLTNIVFDKTAFDSTVFNYNDFMLYDFLNGFSETYNIYPLRQYYGKYVRGYLTVEYINQDNSNLITFNIYNVYNPGLYDATYGAVFCDGKITNITTNNTPNDFYDILKFYKLDLVLNAAPLNVIEDRIILRFKYTFKIYSDKNAFINDTDYTVITATSLFTVAIKNPAFLYDTYFIKQRAIRIYNVRNVRNNEYLLEFVAKTQNAALAPLTSLYFDILKFTDDVEIAVYNTDISSYEDQENFLDFTYTTDKKEILEKFNKYVLLKTHRFSNLNQLSFFLKVRINPKYYGLNNAVITLNSFEIFNKNNTAIIQYIAYDSLYPYVVGLAKNVDVIHRDLTIPDEIYNTYAEKYNIPANVLKSLVTYYKVPEKSVLKYTAASFSTVPAEIKFVYAGNTSGKIYRGNNEYVYTIDPFSIKDIYIEEPISLSDYTSIESGSIRFDVYRKRNNNQEYIETVFLPIPTNQTYLDAITKLFDSLHFNLKEYSERLKRPSFIATDINSAKKNEKAAIYFANVFDYSITNKRIKPNSKNIVKMVRQYAIRDNNVINTPQILETFTPILYLNIFDINLKTSYGSYHFDDLTSMLNELQDYYSKSNFTYADITNMIDFGFNFANANGIAFNKLIYNKISNNYAEIEEYGEFYFILNINDSLRKVLKYIAYKNGVDINIINFDITDIETFNCKVGITLVNPKVVIENLILGELNSLIENFENVEKLAKYARENKNNLEFRQFNIIFKNNNFGGLLIKNLEILEDESKIHIPVLNKEYRIVNKDVDYEKIIEDILYLNAPSLERYLEYINYTRQKALQLDIHFKTLNYRNAPIYINFATKNNSANIPKDGINPVKYLLINGTDIKRNIENNNFKYIVDSTDIEFYGVLNGLLTVNWPYFKIKINDKVLTAYDSDYIAFNILDYPEYSRYSTIEIKPIDYEIYAFSIRKLTDIKSFRTILDTDSKIIGEFELKIENWGELGMMIHSIELLTNLPDANIVVYTDNNETFIGKNIVEINKYISSYEKGVKKQTVYLYGAPKFIGQFDALIKVYYRVAELKEESYQIKIVVVPPKAIDLENIHFKATRLDTPIHVNKDNQENFKNNAKGQQRAKVKNNAEVLKDGLEGGKGFHQVEDFNQ